MAGGDSVPQFPFAAVSRFIRGFKIRAIRVARPTFGSVVKKIVISC